MLALGASCQLRVNRTETNGGPPAPTDLSRFSQSELDKIAKRLNQRPRKTLGFETPASRLQASVASTH
jgi:IS30 family transposase